MNENKKKSLISIRKAITSLKKIEEMIEKDEYCGDSLVQNMAAI
jgi:DNA-binding FrmR family transcriptional regulator